MLRKFTESLSSASNTLEMANKKDLFLTPLVVTIHDDINMPMLTVM